MLKGQWFLISAVVASFLFLTLSTFFRGYYIVDTAKVPRYNEEFIAWNIVGELNRTISKYSTATNLEENLNWIIKFLEEKYRKFGYYVDVNITSPVSPSGTSFIILVKTDRAMIRKCITLP
ncbi:MAG: hypothetical protein J7L43_00690 [Candidatus Aenigmarchaeota archaeon]|nr:hypothetical protein [Candidatus Aenigmarchaeota archaeon]